ncbi:hypothetical protein ACFV2N_45760 [Streptomyces sp. NPDC059680]|uniref:hypothetical protein n=1 Tax=Streptomyces sp. NPDC059680 TaxID=3346904 RepID=UPI003688D7C6
MESTNLRLGYAVPISMATRLAAGGRRRPRAELFLPTVRRNPRIPEAYAAQKVLRFYDPVTENPSKLKPETALSATADYFLATQALVVTRR